MKLNKLGKLIILTQLLTTAEYDQKSDKKADIWCEAAITEFIYRVGERDAKSEKIYRLVCGTHVVSSTPDNVHLSRG